MANFIDTDNKKVEVNVTSNPDNERAVENQNNTVIDIPNENEERSPSKNKKEREHVNFFKQFLLPRVYITAVISVIVILAINIANGIILENIFNITTNSNEEGLDELQKQNEIVMNIFICIIGPIFEELIFRRLIFWFIKKYSLVLAYLISSFLFAFAHFDFNFSILISEIYFLPIYFIMGVGFAYTYDYDGYILASMLSHIFHNSIAVLIDYL